MTTTEVHSPDALVAYSSFSPAPDLPIEVIVHILEYLPLSDRVSAGQVSRLWNEASRDLHFLNNEAILLHYSLLRPIKVFANSNYRILHLDFKDVELADRRSEVFLDKVCPELRSLSIQNCDLSGKNLVDILRKCLNLQSLAVIGCRELLISGRIFDAPSDIDELKATLVKVKEINLSNNRYLSDSLFNRFVSIAPNIEILMLSGCHIAFHSGLVKKFYPVKIYPEQNGTEPMITTARASECVLTFQNILEYISSQAEKIKHLNLGHSLLDNTSLCKLAEIPGLSLKIFEASSCQQLSNPGILALTQHQTAITKLDLSTCTRIVDPSVLSICHSLTNLTSLNLKRCRAITNTSVFELRHLKKLTELDLSYCELVNAAGIQLGLCSWVNPSFRRLRLTALTLDEETVCQLSESLPGLTHLDLRWCFKAVTDRSIQAICCHLVWLRSLKLAGSDELTDAGLTGMGMSADAIDSPRRNLDDGKENINILSPDRFEVNIDKPVAQNQMHSISLRSKAEQDIVNDAKRKLIVSQMCEDQYLKLTGSGHSLSSLRGLQELDLMGCNRITDVSLKYAFNFRELQNLNLGQCQQITYIGVAHLASNNPSIERLRMSQCFNITDDGIISIVKSLTRLKFLDLQRCNQLTNRSLIAIGRHCKNLQHLDVSQCNLMSLEEAENLECVIPSLHTTKLNGLMLKWQPPDPEPIKPKKAPKPPPLGLKFFMKRH